jgi:hypothetical protein
MDRKENGANYFFFAAGSSLPSCYLAAIGSNDREILRHISNGFSVVTCIHKKEKDGV